MSRPASCTLDAAYFRRATPVTGPTERWTMKGVVHGWAFVKRVAEPALALALRDYLDTIRARLAADEIPDAVAERDTPWLVAGLIGVSQFQGISDRNATAYIAKHGIVSFDEIAAALDNQPTCPRLRSYWHFQGCRYRKAKQTCANVAQRDKPQHVPFENPFAKLGLSYKPSRRAP